jgi:energy-coupling factor transport system ATP-binding protein
VSGAIASVEGVTYRYPGGARPALAEVTIELARGSFTLLAGPSAGGKSTLLRLFNGLVPQFHGGVLEGRVTVAGLDPARTPARRMATIAGMVFQEPEAQAVAETVEDEIAFGMEQHGIDPAEMHRRLESLLPAVGVEHLRYRRLATLSGGERQRVAIASVLALEPELLLLDEPTSQLDPDGAASVLDAIGALHRRRGIAVAIAEHRLERLLPRADRVVEVAAGRATAMTPHEAAAQLAAVPPVCQLGRRFGFDPVPLSVEEACLAASARELRANPPGEQPTPGDELLRADGLSVAYGEHLALQDVSLALREGEVVALIGANGSGKSTLFRAIAGLVRPAGGNVRFAVPHAAKSVQARTAFAGFVPQDPAIALYRETVADEVRETLRHRRAPAPAEEVLETWGVAELCERNPRDLSVGQQQRVAMAAMLAHAPRVWLMDEPTRGMDGPAKQDLAARLRGHAAAGGAALVATHDLESAALFATRVVGLEGGRVAFDLPVREALGTHGPRPTQVARVVPGAMLVEDVR